MRDGSVLRRIVRLAGRLVRVLVITATAGVALGVLNVAAHTYFHVCPLHLAHFESRAIVPVVYGLPLGSEMFERAARGEIVMGGCVRGPVIGVCPYCRWPAAFTQNDGGGAKVNSGRRRTGQWAAATGAFAVLVR